MCSKTSDFLGEYCNYYYDNNGNIIGKNKSIVKESNDEAEIGAAVAGETQNDVSKNLYSYKYDNFNQLSVVNNGTNVIRYNYNSEGLRTYKNENGEETRYLYEYGNVILETDGAGNERARNTYGINLVSRTENAETLYYSRLQRCR